MRLQHLWRAVALGVLILSAAFLTRDVGAQRGAKILVSPR